MALQLWETLKESIVAYTGLSPATFFAVLALGLAIYCLVSGLLGSLSDHHQRPRDYQEQMQPLPPPVQPVETSEDELKQYDGSDPRKSLLMANRGQIYDLPLGRYAVTFSLGSIRFVENNFQEYIF
ncbi:hypothetical protein BT93_L0336 [Corymbia citriodora subsp. variegata]|uniref:Uncharacterized protein n=1 Tax=Corymbia citriodora subsp. variegata TaxID=360336 RepID=A0A8T0CQ01_CORYI|nr:hypothetical protein BT93_L0336 [Corymbia citriodora subsp. variegata]